MQPIADGRQIGPAPWMVYDQKRKFRCFAARELAGMDVARATVMREAEFITQMGASGYRGFFDAQWEGSFLRVFVDHCLPPQGW